MFNTRNRISEQLRAVDLPEEFSKFATTVGEGVKDLSQDIVDEFKEHAPPEIREHISFAEATFKSGFRKLTNTMGENPVGTIIGGLAVGIAIGVAVKRR